MRPPVSVVLACFNEVDRPIRSGPRVSLYFARRRMDRHAAIQGVVVLEPALDVLALVPERDGELAMSVATVVHHDVPENRHAANLDHRLGTDFGLLG